MDSNARSQRTVEELWRVASGRGSNHGDATVSAVSQIWIDMLRMETVCTAGEGCKAAPRAKFV
jgi:hypothetical protein